jgi:hypothetical protein
LDVKKSEALIWIPADGDVRALKVSLGLSSDRETEISAGGLEEGAEVIVADKPASPLKRKTGVRLF